MVPGRLRLSNIIFLAIQRDLLPMPEWDHGRSAGVKLGPSSEHTRRQAALVRWAERWLRPADQLDDMISRWVIPVPFGITVHRTELRFPEQLAGLE
jgi:hypothetical protein